MRRTARNLEKPSARGCEKSPLSLFGRRHRWQHSWGWNGNRKSVLPFMDNSHGIARSGWRCYHCGAFAWDQPDLVYAADIAKAYGVDALAVISDAVKVRTAQ